MRRVEYRTSLLDWRTAVLGAVTALITLAAAGIPALSALADRDGTIADRDKQIAALESELSEASALAEDQNERIAELRSENKELRAAVPYTVDPDDVHEIRAVATVTLAERGDTLDLNSTHPNFAADGYVWSDTISYDEAKLKLGSGVAVVRLREGVAAYETCAAVTGWSEQPSLEPHLLDDATTCLRLASGRFATVQVPRFDETSADLVITVWE